MRKRPAPRPRVQTQITRILAELPVFVVAPMIAFQENDPTFPSFLVRL
jgi:hypothetical protein